MADADQDGLWVAKYKIAGRNDAWIARKMGIPEARVAQLWKDLQVAATNIQINTSLQLLEQYQILAHQYALLGQSIKIIHEALANLMPISEITALIGTSDEHGLPVPTEIVAEHLQKHCIILRPFEPVDPEKALKEAEQQASQSN